VIVDAGVSLMNWLLLLAVDSVSGSVMTFSSHVASP
jgi:hypothetical protein